MFLTTWEASASRENRPWPRQSFIRSVFSRRVLYVPNHMNVWAAANWKPNPRALLSVVHLKKVEAQIFYQKFIFYCEIWCTIPSIDTIRPSLVPSILEESLKYLDLLFAIRVRDNGPKFMAHISFPWRLKIAFRYKCVAYLMQSVTLKASFFVRLTTVMHDTYQVLIKMYM